MAMANPDRQKEMAKKLEQGKFSIRDWREQLGSMMNMYDASPLRYLLKLTIRGSLSKITSMIPGMSGMMEEGGEEEASAKLKRMIFITDAMRADELDSDGLIFVSWHILELMEPS
jgi:signal recognition particle subunit SRP54